MPAATSATLSHNVAFAIFVLGVFGLCAFMLGVSSLLGSRAVGRSKHNPFESGILLAVFAWLFPVRPCRRQPSGTSQSAL